MPTPGRRRYRYVGPPEVLDEVRRTVRPAAGGIEIRSQADFERWRRARHEGEFDEPFTFVVRPDGVLRLAARRSEHVACAGGGEVLAAGEIGFARTAGTWQVTEVSNQSTGYCPDPGCWPAVEAALDRAGLPHPGDFTGKLLFRRCPACGERNVVKDDDFHCAVCGAALPGHWNFD